MSVIPQVDNAITFSITGPGEIVATDNGNPTDLTAFPSRERKAYSGLALVIIHAKLGKSGQITVTGEAKGLVGERVVLISTNKRED